MAATTSPPRRPRTRIRFELDSLEVAGGHVVVRGRWHGVRGLRFVRPTLIVGGQEVLATLEHKPWPADADPWIAEFPWEAGGVDPRRTALSVAPSVTVPLAWPGDSEEPPDPAAGRVADMEDRIRGLQVERDALRGRLDEAIRDRDAAMRARARMEAQRDEAFRERNAAERERDALIDERDGVAERRDEAYRDRRVALQSYRRMQEQLDAAKAAAVEKKVERDRAVAERDEVARDCDELRRRLEEAVAELAVRPREQAAPQPRMPDPDEDRPIGTRGLSPAELLASSHAEQAARRGTTAGERAAIRLFGTAAFACAFLLLVNLGRLFF